jgi:hypothetical protein
VILGGDINRHQRLLRKRIQVLQQIAYLHESKFSSLLSS